MFENLASDTLHPVRLFLRSGPAGYLVLLAAIVGMVLLVILLRRTSRDRSPGVGWWLVGPSLVVTAGAAGTWMSLGLLRDSLDGLGSPNAVLVACSGLAVALDAMMLGLLLAVILADLTALSLGAVLWARGAGGLRVERLAMACFVPFSLAVALVAWDGMRGWAWLARRQAMAGWFDVVCGIAAVGVVACGVASLRRLRAREHGAVLLSALGAAALLVAALPVAGDLLGFRMVAGVSVATMASVGQVGSVRFVLLEYGWMPALAGALLVLGAGLPGLPGSVRDPDRRRLASGVIFVAAVAVAVSAILATRAAQERFVDDMSLLGQAREGVGVGVDLAEPVGRDGRPSSRGWTSSFYPFESSGLLARLDGEGWTHRAVAVGPRGDPPSLDEVAAEVPLPADTVVLVAAARSARASELSTRPWFGGRMYAEDLHLLLDADAAPPPRTCTRHAIPSLRLGWWSGDQALRAAEARGSQRASELWLVDVEDGTAVVTPGRSWILERQPDPVRSLQAATTPDTQVLLVPGERWRIQDLVSYCLSAQEIARPACVVTSLDPEGFGEYARLSAMPFPVPGTL